MDKVYREMKNQKTFVLLSNQHKMGIPTEKWPKAIHKKFVEKDTPLPQMTS